VHATMTTIIIAQGDFHDAYTSLCSRYLGAPVARVHRLLNAS
jgi:hypothetical protein